ncbi:protein phosphatase 1 regulatory subunit 7-like [Zophobas morio]|uniref:protein phosphatase 1 regulatory subunit 7-like n=1 Tax=Zophobas morio TaxID=2755281 RepID=UPI003083ADD4
MVNRVFLVGFIFATFFGVIWCACRQSYVTKCDHFEDLKKYEDIENMRTLIIGSEHGDVEPSPVSLIEDLDYYSFYRLTTVIIVRSINQLKPQRSWKCDYHESSLKYFTLYANKLKVIEKDQLPRIALKLFSLVNNGIESVKPYAFYHQIEEIDLSENLLEVIENDSLPSESTSVSIRNNKLAHIEADGFPKGLKNLNLAGNQLRYIPPEVLKNVKNLTELTLSHNKFNSLPPIKHLEQLVVFDISFNSISTLERGTFEKMDNLKLIDLSDNNIHQSDVLQLLSTPGKQPSLTVSLALNRLSNLELENLSLQTQTFVLYGNPWKCNVWHEIKKNLSVRESDCSFELPSNETLPICVSYVVDGDYSSRETEIAKFVAAFREILKNRPRNFYCRDDLSRNKWLYPIKRNCYGFHG